jgi:2-dehydro-3-deoxyphosphooctonate aldolase (KDO 8-P synthase)
MKSIRIGNIAVGGGAPLVLFAGPCLVESREVLFRTAGALKEVTTRLGIPLVLKSSFKKANRTSISGFMGIGADESLNLLAEAKREFALPVMTDIHRDDDARLASATVDVLQIPAFLSRQTELLLAAGETGLCVNIKKGQFLAPEDMKYAAEKVASTGNTDIILCERGTMFGYHNLVVDMRGLIVMRSFGYPVMMDATHAVQIPSEGAASGGRPEFIFPLARAAAAVGIDALFIETHPDPPNALSDAASQLRLDLVESLLREVMAIDAARRVSA